MPPELDVGTVDAVEHDLLAALDDAPTRLVLDLDDLRVVDRTGIRLLLHVRRSAWERDVPIVLRGASPRVRALLDLVGGEPMYHGTAERA